MNNSKNLEGEDSIDTDLSTQPNRKSKSKRRHRKSCKNPTDESTSAPSSDVSRSESSVSESEGSPSDLVPTKGHSKKKTRDKALLSVLRRHEKILQKLAESHQDDDELSELVNGLSQNTLKNALQEERKNTLQNCSEPLETPRLKKGGTSASQVREASMALKEAFKTLLHGNEGEIVCELYQYAMQLAEQSGLSKIQFLNLLHTRVAIESNLGKYVRTALCTKMSLLKFTQGLEVFFWTGRAIPICLEKVPNIHWKESKHQ